MNIKMGEKEIEINPIIAAVFVGIFSFLVIYGVTPLNPQNDLWIMAGYDEKDIIQHYAGWLAFRNSEWQFPIGLAEHMAVGDGTIISYTDSVPWAAIFFKIFSDFLPETFQYFGIYILLCYILQSIAAFKIIYYKTSNIMYSVGGTVLFSFAPILLERSFRHTGLASQWLVLFSILLYLKHKDLPQKRNYLLFLLLEILAIGIHPYFLPMVFVFAMLCVINDLKNKEMWSLIGFVLQLVITYAAGCILGVLGHGVGASRGGFGEYSMNLNALINPTSCGEYKWSAFLPVRPQILGNYDGFNYLGVGVLLLLVFVLFAGISKNRKEIIGMVKRNVFLCFVLVFLTLFAISNVVTLDDKIILSYTLPEVILYLCGIFRASSRLFYPVYYCLLFFLILQLWNLREIIKTKGVLIILVSGIIIQLFDLRYVIIEKHQDIVENADYESVLQNEELKTIAQSKQYLLSDICDGYGRQLAVWAFKNNLQTYYSVANSGVYTKCSEMREETLRRIFETGKLGDVIIVTIDEGILEKYKALPDVQVYQYDEVFFVY